MSVHTYPYTVSLGNAYDAIPADSEGKKPERCGTCGGTGRGALDRYMAISAWGEPSYQPCKTCGGSGCAGGSPTKMMHAVCGKCGGVVYYAGPMRLDDEQAARRFNIGGLAALEEHRRTTGHRYPEAPHGILRWVYVTI